MPDFYWAQQKIRAPYSGGREGGWTNAMVVDIVNPVFNVMTTYGGLRTIAISFWGERGGTDRFGGRGQGFFVALQINNHLRSFTAC